MGDALGKTFRLSRRDWRRGAAVAQASWMVSRTQQLSLTPPALHCWKRNVCHALQRNGAEAEAKAKPQYELLGTARPVASHWLWSQ